MAESATETALNGHRSCVIVITEEIYGRNGLPTLDELASEMEVILNGRMVRSDVLGYIQRGATPSAEDRILASRMASYAIDYARKEKHNVCILVQNGKIVALDLEKTLALKPKVFDDSIVEDYKKYNKY